MPTPANGPGPKEPRARGLVILAVAAHRSAVDVLVVYLHGNAGQWVNGEALMMVAAVPGVMTVMESVQAPSILLVRVEPMNVLASFSGGAHVLAAVGVYGVASSDPVAAFGELRRVMDLDLSGRVAVVTGGSKGIGLAITRTLLAEGVRVVVASRTSTPDLDALPGSVHHVTADLMDPEAPAEIMARAVEVFGALDILVNNAGGPPPGVSLPHGGFLGRTDADWQAIFDFNLFSVVRACRVALPLLIERGGTIVNVSSVNGRQPSSMNLDYAAAKAAVINLTKALSEEFAPQGVRVNGVCPGPVRTPWWTQDGGVGDMLAAQTGADRETALRTIAPEMMSITTGRLVDVQEVADLVALLVSRRSASTTGAEFVVDGGFLKAV